MTEPKSERLRIGLMLRAVDDVDGQGIYIRKLCDALFRMDDRNEYVAFYSDAAQAGRYRDRANVREVVVPSQRKLIWDQVLVPLAARRENLDVLFHHKFSIPLLPPCPAVVQQRGTEYWSHPEFYVGLAGRVDQVYNRVMIPLYCKRAVRILTNSNTLGDELVRHAGVPRSKLRTVYAAADESFRPVTDSSVLGRVRERYALPAAPFLLMVVKGHQVLSQAAGKALTPRKNVEVVLEAYGRMHRRITEAGKTPPPLVILGLGIAERLTPDVIAAQVDPAAVAIAGFVEFGDMPAIYSMARALVFPSRYESFGLPIVEAMACGCPVITSTTSACPEVAGDAAILVDPEDVEGMAAAMQRLSLDDLLAEELRARGLRRAATFSWDESARTLLSELRTAAGADHAAPNAR
ncbi:MAG: glycosyltransferase family 4 protein [Gemmatimonadales bacterium]|nr:glycosyltransferase family 4 protein [Gemmatimonadales bacterium]MDQ3427136.1 glycosyltransferase family 4 protein [Gemmatimonadota bacterium]